MDNHFYFPLSATKRLIDDVRKYRSIKSEESKNQLVEVDLEIFKESQVVISQTGNLLNVLKNVSSYLIYFFSLNQALF